MCLCVCVTFCATVGLKYPSLCRPWFDSSHSLLVLIKKKMNKKKPPSAAKTPYDSFFSFLFLLFFLLLLSFFSFCFFILPLPISHFRLSLASTLFLPPYFYTLLREVFYSAVVKKKEWRFACSPGWNGESWVRLVARVGWGCFVFCSRPKGKLNHSELGAYAGE